MYWLEDHQAANNIGPLDTEHAISPQVNQRSSGKIQVQYTWADRPDVAFIPARLRRVEVFCEFYYNKAFGNIYTKSEKLLVGW